MRSSTRQSGKRRSALRGVLAAPLAAVLVAGCGATTTSREGADTQRGQELFVQECGQCHVLADAGTQGDVGPNLDDAFRFSREQGLGESTFFEVTLEQMEIPGPPMPDYDEPGTEHFLEEQERVDIAAYVASVAGQAPEEPAQEATGGRQIFTSFGCGSCHVLEDAGTTGTVGPNLDESNVTVDEAIEQIRTGGGGMPAYEGRMTEEQIRTVAEYVVSGSGG